MTPGEHARALSIADFSARFSVPAATVRGWIRRGVIPSFKLGGRRLIDLRGVEAVIAAATEGSRGK